MGKKLFFYLAVLWVWVMGWGHLAAQTAESEEMLTPAVTPTVDRLAAPPTVENPNQADEGAYLYWLNCQPCHGDQGQGLTDEWRSQYPMEDQNCWARGCHGERPYEDGFTIPTAVPAVIGEGSLGKFETADTLYVYIQTAMPFNAPSSLTTEEYLAITAFLIRAHGKWTGTPLDEKNVAEMRLLPAPTHTPQVNVTPTAVFTATLPPTSATPPENNSTYVWLGGVLVLVAGGIWVWKLRK